MERDFISTLADLDEGEVNARLTDLLREVVCAVRDTSLAGALNLTIKVTKQGGMIILSPKMSTKKPEPATDATMFFTDDEGNLRRDDPRQLPLRKLDDGPADLRVVPEKTETRKGA